MSAVAYDPSLQAKRSRLLADKVIAITGASSGIGAEAARVFAREGAAVVLGARSEDRLVALRDELAAVGAEGFRRRLQRDQRLRHAVPHRPGDRRHGRLDGAFNNPGISHRDRSHGRLRGLRDPRAADQRDRPPGTTSTPMIAAWRQCDPSIEARLNAPTPLGRGPPRSPTPPRGCSATAPPTSTALSSSSMAG